MNVDQEIAILIRLQGEIAAQKHEVNQLIAEEKEQRSRLAGAIKERLLTMTIGTGRDWLNAMYWKDADLATPVKTAYREVFGGVFTPPPQEMEIQCRTCVTEEIVLCTSWSNYKEKARGNRSHYSSHWHLCKSCTAKQKLEQQERRQHSALQEQKQEQVMENKISQLKNLPYKEYLLTEHWQELRKQALRRARYRCQLCNKSDKLNVHHRTYENLGCEDITDVIVLCTECHEKHHDIKKDVLSA